MSEELAVLERDLEKIPRDEEWIRLEGTVPEMSCEVLLSEEGREFVFLWDGPVASAAVHAALSANPDAAVINVRRVMKGAMP